MDRAKEILQANIEVKNECEILWMLWLLITLGCSNLSENDIINLLNIENDFVRIMVIDYIKKYNITSNGIDNKLKEIEEKLSQLSINISNWLLMYEFVVKGWAVNNKIGDSLKQNNFFKTMLKNNIDFYNINY